MELSHVARAKVLVFGFVFGFFQLQKKEIIFLGSNITLTFFGGAVSFAV